MMLGMMATTVAAVAVGNADGWSGPAVRVARNSNGSLGWEINGQFALPQYFKVTMTRGYARDNWTEVAYELRLACDTAAIPVVAFELDFANLTRYGRTEPGTDWVFNHSFDQATERIFSQVLRACPKAFLWPVIDTWLPVNSCGQRPLDVVTLRVGTKTQFTDYTTSRISPSSTWLSCASMHLERLMQLLDQRFPGKIFGVQVNALETTEWFLPGSCSPSTACFELADYSNSTRDAYCSSRNSGPECELPSPTERINGVYGQAGAGVITTAESAQFAAFLANRTADAISLLARVIKTASRGNAFFATYYGYIFELSGCRLPNSGHFAVSRLLDDENIDGIISPYQYEDSVRLPGGALLPHGVFDSPALRDKLYIVEDDTRTALCFKRVANNESIPDPWCLGMRVDSFSQTRNILLRNLVTTSIHNSGSYWYEMVDDGWFGRPTRAAQSKQLWEMHRAVRSRFHSHFRNVQIGAGQPTSFEVALLVDDTSAAFITPPGGPAVFPLNSSDTQHGSLSYFLHADLMHNLVPVGAPFRTFLLSDILLPTFPVDQLKLVIITAALRVSPAITSAINAKLKSRGRTLLWLYAPGAVSPHTLTLDPHGPAVLTGLPLTLGPGQTPLQATLHDTGKVIGGTAPGGVYSVAPWFGLSPTDSANDVSGVTIWANYTSNHSSWGAIVSQQLAGHTAIFSGVLGLPPNMLSVIARRADVHRWSNGTDDVVERAGNILMLIGGHAGHAQPRLLKLPSRATVHDDSLMTAQTSPPGALVCHECTSFMTTPMSTGEIRLYWLKWSI